MNITPGNKHAQSAATIGAFCLLLTWIAGPVWAQAAAAKVPILYSSDLYHPHGDPDDHFDLMTLFALPEFDIRGIIIDMGERGKGKPGIPALKQVMHITGREVPYAQGLIANLASPEDKAENRPEAETSGIRLILETLEEAEAPITVFTTGSLRDMAAAFNRAPDLFREKVGRFYVNAGWLGDRIEWNVGLDPHAYVRILRSGLPIFWVPCFGVEGYQSLWQFRHSDVLNGAPPPVKNFFLYMLTKADPKTHDPIEYLAREPDQHAIDDFWPQQRNMWCTAAFLHTAGRPMPGCSFQPATITLGNDGSTRTAPDGQGLRLTTFHVDEANEYTTVMPRILRELFAGITPR